MDDGASTCTMQSTKDNHEIVPLETQEVDMNILKSFL